MLYREIAVCSEIHTKHINTLCWQNVELLNVKLVVHIVTIKLIKWKTITHRCFSHLSVPLSHCLTSINKIIWQRTALPSSTEHTAFCLHNSVSILFHKTWTSDSPASSTLSQCPWCRTYHEVLQFFCHDHLHVL